MENYIEHQSLEINKYMTKNNYKIINIKS